MELIKVVKAEWTVIAMAPFSFLIMAAVMFGAAYFIARWRYSAVIDQNKATCETLKERLHLRAEQSESLREKASKYDEIIAKVVDSGESELREKTLKLVTDIREFIGRHRRLDASTHAHRWLNANNATDQDTSHGWEEYARTAIHNSYECNDEYDRRFKIEAIILRDELRSRLPDHKPANEAALSYERPTNFFGFNFVADDLEKMAKAL